MSDAPPARVLLVADLERIGELRVALADPLPQGAVELFASHGGDDTIEMFEAHKPAVVVVAASLAAGDAGSLIGTLRGMVPRAHVTIVVVGDDTGPIRTAIDAMELEPDRFITRPLAPKALRYAVGGLLEQVALSRGSDPSASDGVPSSEADRGADATRAAMRARWEKLADSMVEWKAEDEDDAPLPGGAAIDPEELKRTEAMEAIDEDDIEELDVDPEPEAEALPPPIIIKPRRRTEPIDQIGPQRDSQPDLFGPAQREPTLILNEHAPVPQPLVMPAPVIIAPSRASTVPPPIPPMMARAKTANGLPPPPPPAPPPPYLDAMNDEDSVVVVERAAGDAWSEPVALAEYEERDSRRELTARTSTSDDLAGLAGLDDFDDDVDDVDDVDDDIGLGLGKEPTLSRTISEGRLEVLGDLQPPSDLRAPSSTRPGTSPPVAKPRAGTSPPDLRTGSTTPGHPVSNLGRSDRAPLLPGGEDAGAVASVVAADGRDFARQLRAKMSMMAQRLFAGGAGGDAGAPGAASDPVDHAPRHDHHTEIDLAALGEEPAELGGGGGTEIEGRGGRTPLADARDLVTSPGSWDTQVRERGLPDAGELVRGTSDAPMLLAKTFASQATCHIVFKRGDVEKIVSFDQGRPVFASSNEPLDRMGELLVREGKITASQYERCQAVVAESGRRMGEILVDFGYLKRRELLPAVRRHVEDILYSLFGWDGGQYQIVMDTTPSSERIRLSRHPAALVLEGIRRKLDRSTLERMVGPPSTVIEVPDRERLGGIVNLSDLSAEERAALAAIDGQVDLSAVARAAGVDVADLLPLAWGLVVLGLASARRTDTEIPDESTALVGETDLAIDRERVRARWQLVTEADYFALLGVRRDATGFEIRRAYQSARRDFASDCFPNDLRRELAQELDDIANVLDEAFRVLRDDRLRLTYLNNLFA